MAAGDFGASAIQEAQYKLDLMLANPNTAKTEWQQGEALSARAVLPRQTARTLDRLLDGTICEGAEVWFVRPHAADVDEEDWPTDCDLTAGSEAETAKKNLETTILAYANAKLLDNRCENLVDFQTEFAEQAAHLMARLRRQLNNNVILTTLHAAAMTSIDPLPPTGWDVSTSTVVPPADAFRWENLNTFRRFAMRNYFGNFFFLSGELFQDDSWMAMLNRMNEGERAAFQAYNGYELYFDERDLDIFLTKRTAFAIDVNSYAFWNTSRGRMNAQLIDATTGLYAWSQPDPILRWNKNGQLVPVMWEMEMQKVCTGRTSHGYPQFTYTLAGRLLGGFITAPLGLNYSGTYTVSGVLEFSDTV